MILHVWEDVLKEGEYGVTDKLPKPTFIPAVDLKVTTYNGLSLTTGFDAYFMINPPLRETEPLLSRYNDHTKQIGQLIQGVVYKSADILLTLPSKADILPVKHVLTSMQTLKSAWVFGIIYLIPAQTKMRHSVCDKCKNTVNLPVGSNLPCTFCNEEMNVEPRCHVHIWVNDDSGTLSAALFALIAEKFIGYTATELMEANEKKISLEDEIAEKINKKSVTCFLKDYEKSFESRFERSFPVVHLHVEEEADSAENEGPAFMVDAATTNVQDSALVAVETEKKPFSPATKNVVDEIAIKVGVDQGTPVSSVAVKRGILFGKNSDASEAVLSSEKVPSSTDETVVPRSGSEIPIKN